MLSYGVGIGGVSTLLLGRSGFGLRKGRGGKGGESGEVKWSVRSMTLDGGEDVGVCAFSPKAADGGREGAGVVGRLPSVEAGKAVDFVQASFF